MEPVRHFVSGVRPEGEGVLSQMRWPIPRPVADTYVEAYSRPGDPVLIPYCQGSDVVRAILESGRRALAFNFDPLLMLIVQGSLAPLQDRELQAAVALLGDSPKQGVPLRDFLLGLYATSCPACLRSAVASYYIWDREQSVPVAKQVRCEACEWEGRAAIGDDDRSSLAGIPTKGMHYHFLLDRVAPSAVGDAFRSRLEQLLGLYSPRSLYALAEVALKIDRHFPEEPQNRVLKLLLLDCLQRCSSLMPLPGRPVRRRTLARPDRYMERNVWQEFEESAARMQARSLQPALGLVDTLEASLASGPPGLSFVGLGLVRDLARQIPARSIRLILLSPPSLDASVWSLSYLWSAWLLGAEASSPLRPLLRQRTPDAAWYARVMKGSLRHLGGLLQDGGRLVMVLTEQRTAVIEALLMAAGGAGLGVASLVQCGPNYRLELTPTVQLPLTAAPVTMQLPLEPGDEETRREPEPGPSAQSALEAAIRHVAEQAALETIRARGEPVGWRTLHAAIYQRLAEQALLAFSVGEESMSPLDIVDNQVRAALASEDLVRMPGVRLGEELWWLASPAALAPPLSDRVETESAEVLQGALALSQADFEAAVQRRFPGSLTPEPGLVKLCLGAYGRETSPDHWQLREEDLTLTRQAERQAMLGHLRALGGRLGYRSSPWEPFDLAWSKGGQVQAAFVVRWQALLGKVLPLSDKAPGVQPYLVIPGGRSALASHKVAHNPIWTKTVERGGWRFIKYRHLRHLRQQPEVDEFSLLAIIGLDPIVEKETAQLTLF